MGNRASNVIRASSVSETSTAQKHVRGEVLLETVTYTYILFIFFLTVVASNCRVSRRRRRF